MSLATWLLFTGVPPRCVVSRVRCPWPLISCSPVCPRGVLCAQCPSPLGSCSSMCARGVLCCVSAVLGHFAPVRRCARSVCCVVCTLSSATRLLFTGVPARRVVVCVRCPWPLGSCSPVCPRGVLCARCPSPLGSCSSVGPPAVLCCVCGVLGQLSPLHRCTRSVCCVPYALSLATLLLFTGVPAPCVVCPVCLATWLPFAGAPARCIVLRARCPWPLGSCPPVCPLGVLCCVCRFLATWLRFISVAARCAVSACPWPLGCCLPMCPLSLWCRITCDPAEPTSLCMV